MNGLKGFHTKIRKYLGWTGLLVFSNLPNFATLSCVTQDVMLIAERETKTAVDFARLPEGTRCQLIAGEIIMSPSPVRFHQRIQSRLNAWLEEFVEARNLGEVYPAPFDIYLTRRDAYQPDLLFVSNERLHLLSNDGMHGAPDLLVEIPSPSSVRHDLKRKKDVYEQTGVQEYWVIDPIEKSFECFVHLEGRFQTVYLGKKEGQFCSTVLTDFCIELAKLFAGMG
jgi:Uma2 family endonuclease